MIARADVVKVSADDLRFLSPGVASIAAARDVCDRSDGVVLLTDGARAVEVLGPGWARTLPVPRVDVVDTVGSGDAFGGGFLARWVERGHRRDRLGDADSVVDAALVGIDVAGLTCGRPGADPPRRHEVARLAD